jgi:hypothetical protein
MPIYNCSAEQVRRLKEAYRVDELAREIDPEAFKSHPTSYFTDKQSVRQERARTKVLEEHPELLR